MGHPSGREAYRQGQGSRRMIFRRQAEGLDDRRDPVREADWDVADRELAGLPLGGICDWKLRRQAWPTGVRPDAWTSSAQRMRTLL